MKKTSFTRRNALLSPLRLSIGGVALSVALVALALRLVMPNFFFTLANPFLTVGDSIASGTHTFFSGWFTSTELSHANRSLRQENEELRIASDALRAELFDTRMLLHATSSPDEPGISAGVLMRPPQSAYDTFLVGAGSSAGITTGMEAFGAGGVPLGVVTAVWHDFARVTLFSAPRMQTLGWVGASRAPVSLLGRGGGSLYALVPRAEDIHTGDRIYVPGPGALPYGVVAGVSEDPSSPAVTLHIQPSVSMFRVTRVTLRDVGKSISDATVFATTTP